MNQYQVWSADGLTRQHVRGMVSHNAPLAYGFNGDTHFMYHTWSEPCSVPGVASSCDYPAGAYTAGEWALDPAASGTVSIRGEAPKAPKKGNKKSLALASVPIQDIPLPASFALLVGSLGLFGLASAIRRNSRRERRAASG